MGSITKEESVGRTPAGEKMKTQNAPPNHGRLNSDMRNQMIAESAYYRAQARRFNRGGEMQDWLAAEDEIDRLLLNQI